MKKKRTRKTPGKLVLVSSLVGAALLLLAPVALALAAEIEIQVSPNVLNLANKGQVVTVHTDIAYWSVDSSSVLLNDVEIAWWKSDDRGYFVAKFLIDDIKSLESLEINKANALTLTVTTNSGETFAGTDTIYVIDKAPKK